MAKPRNYVKATEYENRPRQVKRREARNRARIAAVKTHGKAAMKGKEVDHIHMNPAGMLSNNPKNLRVIAMQANRRKQPKHKGYKP